MTSLTLIIKSTDLNNVYASASKQILIPLMQTIAKDTRHQINNYGARFKGVNSRGITSPRAIKVTRKLNPRKDLQIELSPLIPEFLINKEGYDSLQIYPDVTKYPSIERWVQFKYNGDDRERVLNGKAPLIVRNRYASGTPLGHPRRDFFRLAFNNLIVNKAKYGLS